MLRRFFKLTLFSGLNVRQFISVYLLDEAVCLLITELGFTTCWCALVPLRVVSLTSL